MVEMTITILASEAKEPMWPPRSPPSGVNAVGLDHHGHGVPACRHADDLRSRGCQGTFLPGRLRWCSRSRYWPRKACPRCSGERVQCDHQSACEHSPAPLRSITARASIHTRDSCWSRPAGKASAFGIVWKAVIVSVSFERGSFITESSECGITRVRQAPHRITRWHSTFGCSPDKTVLCRSFGEFRTFFQISNCALWFHYIKKCCKLPLMKPP